MRSIILYIAMSLDGYIADREGGVDWLAGQEPGQDMPDSYSTLLERIDTVLLGWNTYHQLTTQLSPEQWPYEGAEGPAGQGHLAVRRGRPGPGPGGGRPH